MTPRAAEPSAIARWPAEHQPNPGYRYAPPTTVVVSGRKCIEVDAGALPWAADIARCGALLKFPKAPR